MSTDVVRSVFAQVFGIPESEVIDSLTYQSYDRWDSVKHMKLVAKLEETFDIEFEMDDILGMENVAKVRAAVEKYLKAK